jgi:hypothetical protein
MWIKGIDLVLIVCYYISTRSKQDYKRKQVPVKKLSQTEISSLLATSARRHQEIEQVQPASMTLDQFYISLGEASKADWKAGRITEEMFRSRVAELKAQYRSLKGR